MNFGPIKAFFYRVIVLTSSVATFVPNVHLCQFLKNGLGHSKVM